jgi:hypothetical protein
MGFAYTIKDQGAVYFVTFTVHQWADVFTRPAYVDELLSNLRYCQEHKGLEVFAWVVMSNQAVRHVSAAPQLARMLCASKRVAHPCAAEIHAVRHVSVAHVELYMLPDLYPACQQFQMPFGTSGTAPVALPPNDEFLTTHS